MSASSPIPEGAIRLGNSSWYIHWPRGAFRIGVSLIGAALIGYAICGGP